MPPKIDSNLYYIKKIDQSGRTVTPTGSLDIQVLLRGDSKIWVSTSTVSSRLIKKTLVLGSWVGYLNFAYKIKMREILSSLLAEGFDIYIPPNIPILEDLALKKYEADGSEPTYEKSIIRKLAEQKLPIDCIFFLDYFWFQKQFNSGCPLFLNINDFSTFDGIEDLVKVAQERKLGCEQIVASSLSRSNLYLLHRAKAFLAGLHSDIPTDVLTRRPTLASLDKCHSICVDDEIDDIYLDEDLKKKIAHDDVKKFASMLKEVDLSKIKSFKISPFLTADALRELRDDLCNTINKYQFKEVTIPLSDIFLNKINPENFVSLTLKYTSSCTFSIAALTDFLKKTTKIEILSIDFSRHSLYMENFKFDWTDLYPHQIGTIIGNFPDSSAVRRGLLRYKRERSEAKKERAARINSEHTKNLATISSSFVEADAKIPSTESTSIERAMESEGAGNRGGEAGDASCRRVIVKDSTVVRQGLADAGRVTAEDTVASSESVLAMDGQNVSRDEATLGSRLSAPNLNASGYASKLRAQAGSKVLLKTKDAEQTSVIVDAEQTARAVLTTAAISEFSENPLLLSLSQSIATTAKDIRGGEIDSQTSDDTKSGRGGVRFHDVKYFEKLDKKADELDPDPDIYRLVVFSDMKEPNFKLTSSYADIDITSFLVDPPLFCNQKPIMAAFSYETLDKKSDYSYYSGRIILELDHKWQPLPSFSPQEYITHLNVTGLNLDEFEIKYCIFDNIYYVRQISDTRQKTKAFISYLLAVPEQTVLKKTDLVEYIKEFKHFSTGKLEGINDNSSKQDIINAVLTQKKGVCRHRARALKYGIEQKQLANAVRIVCNVSHEFVEIQEAQEGPWIQIHFIGQPDNEIKVGEPGARDITDNMFTADIWNEQLARTGIVDAEQTYRAILTTDILTHLDVASSRDTFCPSMAKTDLLEATVSSAATRPASARPCLTTMLSSTMTLRQDASPASPVDACLLPAPSPSLARSQEFYSRAEISCEHSKDFEAIISSFVEAGAKILSTEWTSKLSAPNLKASEYASKLCAKAGSKVLIKTKDVEQTSAMNALLQNTAKSANSPIFVINSPEDLVCSKPWLELNGSSYTGVIKAGPGGPLFRFIESHKKHPEVIILIVNYDNFTAEEIVKFNTILDTERKVDGIPLPEKTLVIGLQAATITAYTGADFTSRFTTSDDFSTAQEQLAPYCRFEQEAQILKPDDIISVNLYESANWSSLLLGQWQLDGDSLTFAPGALLAAKDEGKPLHIINPPNNPEFESFLRDLMIQRRLDVFGRIIDFPTDFNITFSKCYDLTGLLTNKIIFGANNKSQSIYSLNPTLLSRFIQNFRIEDGKLYSEAGILESHQNNSLQILVTRELNIIEWSLFLTHCKIYNITATIEVCRSIILPSELVVKAETCSQNIAALTELNDDFSIKNINQDTLVVSEDVDFNAYRLESNKNVLIIDVSDLEANNFLTHTEATSEGLGFKFIQYKCVVQEALEAEKVVVLKGSFEDELIDILSGYILQFKQTTLSTPRGKLVVITTPANVAKFDFIEHRFKDSRRAISSVGHVRTDTIERYKQVFPEDLSSTEAPWLGIKTLPEDACAVSILSAAEFEKQRLDSIEKALTYSPIIFIAGPTGVGKSTFVTKVLKEKENYQIYIGEEQSLAWATAAVNADKINKKIVLFIDESNIGSRNWSEFEGLYAKKPYIIIAGKIHYLSPIHKVIFAGNPSSYGSRHTPSLFERHGFSVLFKPMSLDYIKQHILLPALGTVIPADKADEQKKICNLFLEMYQFICHLSSTDILISPRELEMMALQLCAKYTSDKTIDLEATAQYYAVEIARLLIPKAHKSAFETKYPVVTTIEPPSTLICDGAQAYQTTPSRAGLLKKLYDLLLLRDFRQSKEATTETQKYGGLGGLIIEGAPGEGKSHAVIAYLNHCKLKLNNDYCVIPASLDIDQKTAMLIQACKQGQIVIIDELNCIGDCLERLLNDLLMGKLPDGTRPIKPGFCLIATQNPITMAGRSAQSTALDRRTQKIVVPNYTSCEILQILQSRGQGEVQAKMMVKAFTTIRAAPGIRQEITFRDLITQCKKNRSIISMP